MIDLDKLIAKVKGEPDVAPELSPQDLSTWGEHGFPRFSTPAPPVTPRIEARRQVDSVMGRPGAHLSASDYLKQSGVDALLGARLVLYTDPPNRAWMVEVDADAPEQAAKLGQRVRRNLIGKRSLSSWQHFVHEWPLFVVYDKGYVRLQAPPPKAKGTESTVSSRKRTLLAKARGFFGQKGASLAGSEEDGYALTLRPALKKLRRVFSAGTARGTLDELDAALDSAIDQVERLLESQ